MAVNIDNIPTFIDTKEGQENKFQYAPKPFLKTIDGDDLDAAKINLHEFDMSTMDPHSTCVAIGMRGSGKSTVGKNILYHMRNEFSYGIVQSATELANPSWSKMVPSLFIYTEFNQAAVFELVEQQNRCIQEQGRENCPTAFIIFDDLMYDNSFVNSKALRFLLMNGRHFKIFLFITVQYSLGINPALRANMQYIFLLKETNYENRIKLWRHYAGIFPTFQSFEAVFRECTNNRDCMAVKNNVSSYNITDSVFFFRPELNIPDFQLGDDEFKSFAKHNTEHNNKGSAGVFDPEKKRMRDELKVGSGMTMVQKIPLGRPQIVHDEEENESDNSEDSRERRERRRRHKERKLMKKMRKEEKKPKRSGILPVFTSPITVPAPKRGKFETPFDGY